MFSEKTIRRALLLATWLVLAMPAVARAASYTFNVDARQGWQTTSLFVRQSQKLTFSAEGAWSVDYRNFPFVGPNGYPLAVDRSIYQGCKLVRNLTYGIWAYAIGPLSFRIHDGDACLGDNAGSVKVTVTETRPSVAQNVSNNGTKKEILTNADMIELTKLGLSEATIIEKIRHSQHRFDTSVDALRQLKEAQVSDAVIREMISSQVPVNRQLVCVNYCGPHDDPLETVQITVTSFTFDTAQHQTLMRLSLDPQSSSSNCSFSDGLSFQDETGKTYQPGGQLKDGGSFSLVKGQQQRLGAIYAFIPSAGSTYTLRPGRIFCIGGSLGTYGDAQFTF